MIGFCQKKKKQILGVTVVELLLVFGILTLLSGLITINLFNAYGRHSVATTIDMVVADIKQQQMKAMIGDTEGRATADAYGVRFENNRYILFHGAVYSPVEPSNAPVALSDNLNFVNITFPSAVVVFSALSGEVVGFTAGSNTVAVKDINTGEQKTIEVNPYGAVANIY